MCQITEPAIKKKLGSPEKKKENGVRDTPDLEIRHDWAWPGDLCPASCTRLLLQLFRPISSSQQVARTKASSRNISLYVVAASWKQLAVQNSVQRSPASDPASGIVSAMKLGIRKEARGVSLQEVDLWEVDKPRTSAKKGEYQCQMAQLS